VAVAEARKQGWKSRSISSAATRTGLEYQERKVVEYFQRNL